MSDAFEESLCAACGQRDDHPKFHLIGPSANGLGWTTMHHDCAASQGHEHAALIVQAVNGLQGEELREALTDDTHPVHEAVQSAIDELEARSLAEGQEG
jgi:hypothetical protein